MKTTSPRMAMMALLLLLAQAAHASLTDGLVAYYPFNGSAADQSGNHLDGVLQNGVTFGFDALGNPSSAASFTGLATGYSDECRVAIPESELNGRDAFTVHAQFKIRSDKEWHTLLGGGFSILVRTDQILVIWNYAYPTTFARVTIPLNQWTDLAVSSGGGVARCHINGVPVPFLGGAPQVPVLAPGDLFVGAQGAGNPIYGLDGQIDNLRIYNRALSDSEVSALYQLEGPPVAPAITQQPTSPVLALGGTFSVSGAASGIPAPAYQWIRDGNPVPGATNAALVITNVQPSLIGDYRLVASNTAGSATSSVVALAITGVDASIWKGLVAYYPFDGNADNAAMNSSESLVYQGPLPATDRFGRAGHAFAFPGTGFMRTKGPFGLVGTSPRTVSLWVYRRTGGRAGLVGWGSGNGGYGRASTLFAEAAGRVLAGGFYSDKQSVSALLNTNEWVHLAMTYADSLSSIRIYANGREADSLVTQALSMTWDTQQGYPLFVGSEADSGGATLDGVIDDVRIYNRALSETEVKSLFDYESVPPNGKVVAWGAGTISTGVDPEFGQSVVPQGLVGVKAIAAAYAHTLALRADGTVAAWGRSSDGQVSVPVGLDRVVAVGGGVHYSVALKGDGTVVTWGGGSLASEIAVPIGLNSVTAIAAGSYHVLALKADGTVVAWGRNDFGQASVPAGLVGVKAISTAGNHSVALKLDGTVVAWGNNSHGQAAVPAGLNGVVAVTAGGYHTVALKSDGTVVAWGAGKTAGGEPNYGQSLVPVGLYGVRAISAGAYHTLALKGDGTVAAWGLGSKGQVSVPVDLKGVAAISAGGYHSVVLAGESSSDSPLWKGLVAYYPFNGSAADQSGNHLDGIMQNGAGYGPDALGNPSSAANFSGVATSYDTENRVLIPSAVLDGRDTFTLHAQFKIRSDKEWHTIASGGSFACLVRTDHVLFRWNSALSEAGAAVVVPLNQWTAITVAQAGGVARCYINGKAVSLAGGAPGTLSIPAGDLFIGGRGVGNYAYGIDGEIDNFRAYSRALSDAEVAALYALEAPPVAPAITQQPTSPVLALGGTFSVSGAASGIPAPAYQWIRDGNPVPGATNAALVITNVQPPLIGDYRLVASNTAGSATSSVVALAITGVDASIWKGLVAYYPFDGDSKDASGNSRHLTATASPSYGDDRFGSVSKAARFPEGSKLPPNNANVFKGEDVGLPLGNSPRTVTMWFNASSISPASGADTMFHWGGYSAESAFYGYVGSGDALVLGKAGGGNQPEWRGVAPSQWFSAAFVFSADGAASVFVNGTLKATGLRSYNTALDPMKLTIGGYNGYSSYDGRVDDVRIYNRALSGAEVATLYAFESVPQQPVVAASPADTTVNAGGTLSLVANVTGYKVVLQWQKDGVPLVNGGRISGATSTNLVVTGVVAGDAGVYRLVGANAFGSATTTGATVSVVLPPVITQQPVGATVALGGTHTFTGLATGVPSPTYQWTRDGKPIPGATSATLVIADVQPAFIGEYRLVASNSSGTATSSVASLNITGLDPAIWKGLVAYYPFNGSAADQSGNRLNGTMQNGAGYGPDVLGNPNSAANFSGKATSYDTENRVLIPSSVLNGRDTFTLHAQLKIRSDKEWHTFVTGGQFSLLIRKGQIMIAWNSADPSGFANVALPLDQWVTVTVTQVGGVARCYLDGKNVPLLGGSPKTPAIPAGDLFIGGRGAGNFAYGLDGEIENFRAYNRALSDAEVAALYALEAPPAPPAVAASPANTTVNAGGTLSLVANVTGYQVALQWQKDGVPLVDGGRISGTTSTNLVVTGVMAGDAGVYRLVGANALGSATTTGATVTVQVAPSIAQQPVGGAVVEGSPFTLSVVATAVPVPAYQWSRDGVPLPGATNASLTLPAMTADDAGGYQVTVSNPAGSVASSVATVAYLPALRVYAGETWVQETYRTLGAVPVRLEFGDPDWFIFYTTDGSEPDYSANAFIAPFLLPASAVVKAVAYAPDFSASVPGRAVRILVLQPQTIGFGPMPSLRYGDTVTVNASASSGLPVALRRVSGPVTLSGGTLTTTGVGPVVLEAVQAGDDVYAPATNTLSLVVGKAPQALSWPVLSDKTFGDPAFGVVVTAGSGLPVTLGVTNSKASVTGTNVTLTGAGVVTLVASQPGDSNRLAVLETRSFNVAKANQSLVVPALADRVFTPVPFTPAGTASSKLPLQFQVVGGPAQVTAGGQVQLTGVGAVLVRATQPGNEDWNAAPPVDRSFVVGQAGQTISFAAIPPVAFGDAPVTLDATASSGLTPVTFAVVGGPGSITEGNRLSFTGAGSVVVQADQAGNANYRAASAQQTITVAKAVQSIAFAPLPNVGYSTNPVVLTATAGSGLPVAFAVAGGPAVLTGGKLGLTGVGTVSVVASQAGDANHLAAAPVTNTFTVVRGTQSIAFTPVGDQVLGNGPLTLVATSSSGLKVAFQMVSGPATVAGDQLSLLNEGTVVVRALQLGSPLWLPAQQDQSFEVRKLTTLALNSGVGGTIAVDPAKDLYAPTDTVTVTATAGAGFAFRGWGGSLSGTNNPATLSMAANRTVTAAFDDIAAPVIALASPAAGVTSVQAVVLGGTATDNVGVTRVRWERDGVPQGELALSGGKFEARGLVLNRGDNRFRVVAVDAAGNESSKEVLVTWQPDRTLLVESPAEVQEGRLVEVPVRLESRGEVGGMNFVLHYDTNHLKSPVLTWDESVEAGFNQVNTDVPGEVRAEFALPASTVGAGTRTVASVAFRTRSVPSTLETRVVPEVLSLADSAGQPLPGSTDVQPGTVRIAQRRIVGDNNANQQLDVGDAAVIQRLSTGLDPLRPWDVVGNDLNTSGTLDVGDTILVMRAVVGLDPQPRRQRTEDGRRPAGAGLAGAGAGPVLSIEPERTVVKSGETLLVRVSLSGMASSLYGLSFHLDYPTNALWLQDSRAHRAGAIVPESALVIWNLAPAQKDYSVQRGDIALGVSSATAWPANNGVVAEFVFQVRPGVESQAVWPLTILQPQLATDGFDILTPSSAPKDLSNGTVVVGPARLDAGRSGMAPGGFRVAFDGASSGKYVVEAAEALEGPWVGLSPQLSSASGKFEFTDASPKGARYYRIRAAGP